MSTGPQVAIEYILMFMVAGFLLWLLQPIMNIFRQYSETGTLYTLANYFWDGAVFIILILSIFWFIRRIKEWQYVRGGQ